jgi:hypothetical protein
MTAILPIKRFKIKELAVADQGADWRRLKALVFESVSSPITKRVYTSALMSSWRGLGRSRDGLHQGDRGRLACGTVSTNVRIVPFKKLADEASGSGLLTPELVNRITHVMAVASKGLRLENWLSSKQAQALLSAPDATTNKACETGLFSP